MPPSIADRASSWWARGACHHGASEMTLVAGRVFATQPRPIARPRSSLVLREHDSSGVLTFKSARGKP